ncbi:response regulator [Emticicia sp. SJ17W-69]|uniref:response regulator n=1 Tax=Emticicia sp. SJ17W-69 TaxID=3421657 RepID=UPI003EBFDEF0
MNNTELHRLLAKQISKYLSEDYLTHEKFQSFVKAVNDSYLNFERDKELFEHSSQLNEKEYAEVNAKLKKEIKQRRLSVEKLIEAIRSLEVQEGLHTESLDSNNLLSLVDFLQIQIDNRKQIEIELRKSKEAAEQATQAKSEFLSMMSHEIRTPLNAIVGLTYLMQQEEMSENMAENLKILQFSTDNLHVLINDILDFSKIEAGKVELERISFDFKQLISNIKKANQVKAEEKGNKIRLMIDDDVPNVVIGDSLRLGQIISNLVSNAVKFTRNGSITVELACLRKFDNRVAMEVSVADTGIGIPLEKQALIFEKFTQANSETTRQFGGTGLGLVITKKLLELYDSEIQLESEAGKGAKFFFTIELEIGSELKNKASEGSNELLNENTLKGVRILLVEDYPINIKVATKFLERWQVELDVAENGLIATEKHEKGRYDVILMDIQMPVMDGYSAAEKIREVDSEVPIIALTASATFTNQDRAFIVGMNDYVTKPFNPKELYQKIAKYSFRD